MDLDFEIGSLPPSIGVALSVGTACLSQEPRGKSEVLTAWISLIGYLSFQRSMLLTSFDVDFCRFGKGKTYKIKRSPEIECIYGLYTL